MPPLRPLYFFLLVFAAVKLTAASPVPVELAIKDARIKPPTPLLTAQDRVFLPGPGTLTWKLPADFPAGNYTVEFAGTQPNLATEWVAPGNFELEPFRFAVGTSEKTAVVQAFSFAADADPAKPARTITEFRHKQLGIPLVVVPRRSDHPLALKPGSVLVFEARWNFSLAGDFRLLPAGDGIVANVSTTVPFHLFDETLPVRFDLSTSALGKAGWQGSVAWRWVDALAGVVEESRAVVNLTDAKPAEQALQPKAVLPFGAYTLEVEWLGADGKTVSRQQRHFTYSPRFDRKDLPDSWPFAWHLRPFDPMIPPVGFKWLRLFDRWFEMEPAKGKFDWAKMDQQVEMARAGGYKILWITGDPPRWASPHPDAPSQPKEGVLPFWGYPPKDWKDLEEFTAAFWQRYAPGGDTSVVGAVEVLNEPNVTNHVQMTYAEYAKMCEVVYRTTKQHAPKALVIGVGLSGGYHPGWVNGVLDAGAGQWMDAASLHNYEFNTPTGAVSIASKIELLRSALDRNGQTQKPIWNTEVGISSWGRWGGRIWDETVLEERARSSPNFDPVMPHKIGRSWRAANESVAAGCMVRSTLQQVALGVSPTFYFKWQANHYSWVHDWAQGGNVVPKVNLPVQAVMSHLYWRYGRDAVEPLKLESPDPAYEVFAHRFRGPEGRLTVLYAHPRRGSFVIGDELAGNAFPNALAGEFYLKDENGKPLPAPPPFDQELFQVTIPGLQPGAVLTDILVRTRTPVSSGDRIPVRQMPIYLVESNDAAPWPVAPVKNQTTTP